MSNSKAFKRLVRERMAITGEGYSTALRAIREGGDPRPKVKNPEGSRPTTGSSGGEG